MRRIPVICVLLILSALSLTQADRKVDAQKSKITKLQAVNLGEGEVDPDSEQSDVQRKRHSGYSYNRPNRILLSTRLHLQAKQPKDHVTSSIHGQLNRPFTKYGPPPNRLTTHGSHVQQNRDASHNAHQQQSGGFDAGGLMQQEVPSSIRNVDFTEANPIASQNNEPFGMHTANYLPPQNQKLPADYTSTNSFLSHAPSLRNPADQGQTHGAILQSQNLLREHQISDASLFLSENAQAIQQLYGAPASNQDFAPSNDHPRDQNDQFGNFESTLQNPQEFRVALPPYASGTINPQETLQQIQSLEKDRLIVQLQQALAHAQTTPSSEAAGRYAQDQSSFIQNQELLAAISQQMRPRTATTPQTIAVGAGDTAFSQSPFLPGTTINPLGFPFAYDVSATTQTPTATTLTGVSTARPPPFKGDSGPSVTSSLPAPNRPGTPAITSSVGIPIYGGFVPTVIRTNFIPSYDHPGIFTSGQITPVQPTGSSQPTQFGIPIPMEPARKPATGPAPSIPTSLSTPASSHPEVPLTPAITPIALPVQPIRPVATLHPLATPVHPITTPLQAVLPGAPAQVHPVQATPAVTSGVHPPYSLHTPLINSIFYKPVKALYPVYYYPNVAYQLQQKPALPSYPWSYAPSYSQARPAQIWK